MMKVSVQPSETMLVGLNHRSSADRKWESVMAVLNIHFGLRFAGGICPLPENQDLDFFLPNAALENFAIRHLKPPSKKLGDMRIGSTHYDSSEDNS